MKVVLDTNVVISGIFWQGTPNEILKLIEKKQEIDFIQSIETFGELAKVIHRGKFAEIAKRRELKIDTILESLLTVCKFYQISRESRDEVKKEIVIDDVDDLIFIELAVEAEADYIISGDPHLLDLKEYKKIKIVKPVESLKAISV